MKVNIQNCSSKLTKPTIIKGPCIRTSSSFQATKIFFYSRWLYFCPNLKEWGDFWAPFDYGETFQLLVRDSEKFYKTTTEFWWPTSWCFPFQPKLVQNGNYIKQKSEISFPRKPCLSFRQVAYINEKVAESENVSCQQMLQKLKKCLPC